MNQLFQSSQQLAFSRKHRIMTSPVITPPQAQPQEPPQVTMPPQVLPQAPAKALAEAPAPFPTKAKIRARPIMHQLIIQGQKNKSLQPKKATKRAKAKNCT